MKKKIAYLLLAMAILMLAACGKEAAKEPTGIATEPEKRIQETLMTKAPEPEAQIQETQLQDPKEQETQSAAPLVYAGVYQQPWSEEIGGTVVERYAYIVLNEDHTGYWIVQGVATLNWNENQLETTVGEICEIELTQENGTVNLLVYPDTRFDDTNEPKVYEKIEELPEEVEAMIAENAMP